ncbi:MAG: hypothetical protein AB1631_30770 [Acidobacteriota bacterium]
MTNTIKRAKLAAAILALSAFCFTSWRGSAQETEHPRPEIIGIGAGMNERIGADDGAALVIHFSGDIHGGLEPCG